MNQKTKSLFDPEKSSAQLLQLMAYAFDQTDMLSGIIDLDGQIIHVNQTVLSIIGKKPEDISGMLLSDFLHHHTSIGNMHAVDEIIARTKMGKTQIIEHVFFNNTGQRTSTSIYFSPIFGVNGNTIGLALKGQIEPGLTDTLETTKKKETDTQQWINSISTASIKCDLQGRIIAYNKAFLYLLEMSSSGFLDENINDIIQLEIFKNCQPRLKNAIKRGGAGEKIINEIELTASGDSLKNYIYCISPIKNGLDQIEFLAIEIKDITEHVRLREDEIQKEKEHSRELEENIVKINKKLVRTEQFNESIINSAPMGIVYLDADHKIVHTNPKLERILETVGISKEGIKGSRLSELNIYQANHLWKKTSDSMDQVQTFGRKKMVLFQDNRELYNFEVLWGPLSTPDGNTHGTVMTFNDVTDKIQLEAELQNTRIQAEKMSSLGLVISGVAHEINNPLTSILGCAEYLLEESVDSSDAQEAIRIIVEDSRRAEKTVKNLLMMAHPPESESDVRVFDLNELIENTMSLRIREINDKSLRANLHLDREIRPVMANRIQLQQVILNILQNSINAIEESGTGDCVRISTKEEKNWIVMRLEDNGPGIPSENRSKIFDPFFTTKPQGKGTGLGLSISYGVIKRHGGFINLDPDMTTGTCFVVRLPAVVSLADESEVMEYENPTWIPSTVLIAGNEIYLRRSLSKFMENLGCAVHTENNGRDALRTIGVRSFDLILADVKMPLLTGMDLYCHLQDKLPKLTSRFAFMTSLSNNEIQETAKKPDVPLLQKPFSRKDVIRLFSQIKHRLDLQEKKTD